MNDEEFLNGITEDDIDLSDDEEVAAEPESTPADGKAETVEKLETKENQPAQSQESQPEDEDKKVLEYLNKKGLIKFNGENVQIKDLNDLVSNYQKGLNYDKIATRESKVMDYIKEKASNINISPE